MCLRLHRDQEVGVISGELEKEGFYGTEIQLHGFVYGNYAAQVCIVEDEMDAAVQAYNLYLQGTLVSALFSHSHRIYGEPEIVAEEKEKFIQRFGEELQNSIDENGMIPGAQAIDGRISIQREEVVHSLSGFVFVDSERLKVMANAYFPQTFKWWSEKKLIGASVGDIVVRLRDRSECTAKQLKNFKDDLLKIGE